MVLFEVVGGVRDAPTPSNCPKALRCEDSPSVPPPPPPIDSRAMASTMFASQVSALSGKISTASKARRNAVKVQAGKFDEELIKTAVSGQCGGRRAGGRGGGGGGGHAGQGPPC